MERKGDVSEVIMVIFALAVGILILYLLVPKIAMPSMRSYGDKQAYITAKVLASSVNSLSSVEQGEVVKGLELEWNINVECKKENQCYIVVGHKNFISTNVGDVALMGNVEETHIYGVAEVNITKEIDKPVRIKEITED